MEGIETIFQGMKTHIFELEGLAQANVVLTVSSLVEMAQLAQMTVTMNTLKEKLKTLASAQTNQSRPKGKHYCWSCGSNYIHRIALIYS